MLSSPAGVLPVVMMSSSNASPYGSGVQEVLAGNYSRWDSWSSGWDVQVGILRCYYCWFFSSFFLYFFLFSPHGGAVDVDVVVLVLIVVGVPACHVHPKQRHMVLILDVTA